MPNEQPSWVSLTPGRPAFTNRLWMAYRYPDVKNWATLGGEPRTGFGRTAHREFCPVEIAPDITS